MCCRSPTEFERSCVANCAQRQMKSNQRFMQQFMKVNPEIIARRIEEAQQKLEKLNLPSDQNNKSIQNTENLNLNQTQSLNEKL